MKFKALLAVIIFLSGLATVSQARTSCSLVELGPRLQQSLVLSSDEEITIPFTQIANTPSHHVLNARGRYIEGIIILDKNNGSTDTILMNLDSNTSQTYAAPELVNTALFSIRGKRISAKVICQ